MTNTVNMRSPRTQKVYFVLLIGLTSVITGCTGQAAETPSTKSATAAPAAAGVAKAASEASPGNTDGDWVRAARDYANTRFSPLNQITSANAKQLRVAWTFSTGVDRGQEAAPLVVGDTMYVVTPYPNILYALDLTRPGAPMKWRYRPETEAAGRRASPAATSSTAGAAYADGQHLLQHARQPDGRGRRGERHAQVEGQARRHQHGRDDDDGAAGREGQGARRQQRRRDGRARLADGARLPDGRIAWRAYSTGPDHDVLIGRGFKPFYEQDQGKDLGVSTWPPDAWKIGGGNGLGLDLVRPRAEPDLLRHRQPRPVEPGAAARRQQVDVPASSRATPTPARRSGSTSGARTTCTTTTASTRTSCSTCRSTASPGR